MKKKEFPVFKEFTYHLPTKILFGIGISERLSEEVKRLGSSKPLIITDRGIIQAGIGEKVEKYLKKDNLNCAICDGVVANPTLESIEEMRGWIRKKSPDIVIALGGGSSIDTAKLAVALQVNRGPLSKFKGYGKFEHPRRIPLVAIETAAGTGAEVTLWAPVVDRKRGRKIPIGDPSLAPDLAICDPILTVSMPPRVTAETGVDALSHALECYLTKGAWHIPDALAVYSIEMIFKNLRTAVSNGENIEARKNMLMASVIAGMAFPHAGAGMVHGMGHPLSGLYNLSHGSTMGMLLPYVEEFNLPTRYEKLATVARVAGENIQSLSVYDAAEKAILALRRLNKDIGIPTMEEAGVKKDDMPWLAEEAFTDKLAASMNPRRMTKEDILHIYRKAFDGN